VKTPGAQLFGSVLNRLGPAWLPFADAASPTLPLGKLARLSLFQVSVGMALVLLNGTLNRVMIVELSVPAWLVATMVSVPLLIAPLRALIGHRSDSYVSVLGWRRVPFMGLGTMLQYAGLGMMPFALLVLSEASGTSVLALGLAGLAFLLVGSGLHITQTAGLALASDLASEETRPRVVAFLYVMLLLGMVLSALVFGSALAEFSQLRLIQVIQSAAVVTLVLNVVALWKQEVRNPALTAAARPRRPFSEAWAEFMADRTARRLLLALGLGTAAFSMQDILLEPYGGEVLALNVAETTVLTALLAGGSLLAFVVASRRLALGEDPHRLAAFGAVLGVLAFALVVFSAPLAMPGLFRLGTILIGVGGGFFAIGTLTAAMALAERSDSGLALGAWGAVQATAMGLAVGAGGALRDGFASLAEAGALGPALNEPSVGYSIVYHIEIALLFAALAAIGPLVRHARRGPPEPSGTRLGLAEFPG
jgi:BCD family chlorophyll transporter-like MFS transporter